MPPVLLLLLLPIFHRSLSRRQHEHRHSTPYFFSSVPRRSSNSLDEKVPHLASLHRRGNPDATPERKKALLLNALGVEGLDVYYKAADEQTQLDSEQSTGDSAARDAYQPAFAILDACFVLSEDAVCVRALFQRWVQEPDETAVQYIQELRRLADTCSFGTAANTMLQDQILQGLRDAHLNIGPSNAERVFSHVQGYLDASIVNVSWEGSAPVKGFQAAKDHLVEVGGGLIGKLELGDSSLAPDSGGSWPNIEG
ncbi:hypothetical protein MTO96_023396 [Rhipicephalus appendiculatus]